MSATLISLLVGSQVVLVVSQLFLKHAMNLAERTPRSRGSVALFGGLFVAAMTLWFLLWLGFLQILPLSKVLPWEGLSPVLLVTGAAVFLREKISAGGWFGILLISAGVVLVSLS
jgi:undecaprenyl phosphate-alpha-L-ara4N flippase subunit ArnE